jgi:hypothetical protein
MSRTLDLERNDGSIDTEIIEIADTSYCCSTPSNRFMPASPFQLCLKLCFQLAILDHVTGLLFLEHARHQYARREGIAFTIRIDHGCFGTFYKPRVDRAVSALTSSHTHNRYTASQKAIDGTGNGIIVVAFRFPRIFRASRKGSR